MDLGKHFTELAKTQKDQSQKPQTNDQHNKAYSQSGNAALDIILFIKSARRNLPMSRYITKASHIKAIEHEISRNTALMGSFGGANGVKPGRKSRVSRVSKLNATAVGRASKISKADDEVDAEDKSDFEQKEEEDQDEEISEEESSEDDAFGGKIGSLNPYDATLWAKVDHEADR